MVKKSSFLERLFRSRKVGGDGRVGGAPVGRRAPAAKPGHAKRATAQEVKAALEAAAERGAAGPGSRATEPDEKNGNGAGRRAVSEGAVSEGAVSDAKGPEAKSGGLTRVLGGRREEAAQALTEGFHDLSALLRGIQERMDAQGGRAAELNDKFADLPATAKAQVDFMATVSRQLADQREKTSELLVKLGGLPGLLEGIHKTLERHAAVEERTEKNLKDFRTTMDRIHSSIGQLTKESQKAVKDTTDSFERSQNRATRVFEETQKQAYETFTKTQQTHLEQLSQIVERSGRMNRGIVVLLVLVFGSLVALFGIVLGR